MTEQKMKRSIRKGKPRKNSRQYRSYFKRGLNLERQMLERGTISEKSSYRNLKYEKEQVLSWLNHVKERGFTKTFGYLCVYTGGADFIWEKYLSNPQVGVSSQFQHSSLGNVEKSRYSLDGSYVRERGTYFFAILFGNLYYFEDIYTMYLFLRRRYTTLWHLEEFSTNEEERILLGKIKTEVECVMSLCTDWGILPELIRSSFYQKKGGK